MMNNNINSNNNVNLPLIPANNKNNNINSSKGFSFANIPSLVGKR